MDPVEANVFSLIFSNCLTQCVCVVLILINESLSVLYSKKLPNLHSSPQRIFLLSLSLIIEVIFIVLPIPLHNSFFLKFPLLIYLKM